MTNYALTEDQIGPLCQRLFESVRDEKTEQSAALAIELLAGFLIDVNRISFYLGHISVKSP